jgi:ribosomal protein S8
MQKTELSLYNIINQLFKAQQHKKSFVYIPYTIESKKLISFFYKKGFISIIQIIEKNNNINNKIISYYKIYFNYLHTSISLFNKIKFISKPSKRFYISYKKINKFLLKYRSCLTLIKTPYGYLTLVDCLYFKIGGEFICILS